MKKTLLLLTLIAGLIACKDQPKNEAKEASPSEEVAPAEEKEQIAAVHYACPMDCEDGKVYDLPGNCPVCKMKLVDTKKLNDGDDHGDHGMEEAEHEDGELHELKEADDHQNH